MRLRPLAVLASLSLFAIARSAAADPSSTSPEQGFDLGEIPSPRAVAMGGAQYTLGSSTTALYLNPASLLLAKVYHLEALAAFTPEARRPSFGAGVADSQTNKMAGAVGGMWSVQDPDGINRSWTDLRVALAYPLGEKLNFGVTGRYLRVTQDVAKGPLGSSLVSDGTKDGATAHHFTADVGFTALASEKFRFALLGRNLTHPGNSLAPTQVILGGGFTDPESGVSVELDVLADFDTWKTVAPRAMLGGEYFFKEHYAARVGYRYDHGPRVHSVSLGGSYIEKKWGVELSGRRDIIGEHQTTMMVLGLRYFHEVQATTEGSDTM